MFVASHCKDPVGLAGLIPNALYCNESHQTVLIITIYNIKVSPYDL